MSDHLTKLTFASIDHLANGEAADAVNLALRRAIADLHQWGGDHKARTVVVEISLRQVSGLKGRFEASFAAKVKLPGEKAADVGGYVERQGDDLVALFNPVSVNPDQLTLPIPEPETPAEPAKKRKKA